LNKLFPKSKLHSWRF